MLSNWYVYVYTVYERNCNNVVTRAVGEVKPFSAAK